MKYSQKSKSYEPKERTLLQKCSDSSRIQKSYDKKEKHYTAKEENSLYKARVKQRPYLNI